jgi:hypothetical protein
VVRSDTIGSSPPDDTWRKLSARREAPLGAQSLRLQLSAERDGNAASAARIDLVRVPEPSGALSKLVGLLCVGLLVLRSRVRVRQ